MQKPIKEAREEDAVEDIITIEAVTITETTIIEKITRTTIIIIGIITKILIDGDITTTIIETALITIHPETTTAATVVLRMCRAPRLRTRTRHR